jgi:hypothetical protein
VPYSNCRERLDDFDSSNRQPQAQHDPSWATLFQARSGHCRHPDRRPGQIDRQRAAHRQVHKPILSPQQLAALEITPEQELFDGDASKFRLGVEVLRLELALEIFLRYSGVEKASGEQVTLKEYLEHVWAAVSKKALNMIFAGELVLDRVRHSMILCVVGRGEALKRLLVDEGVGCDQRFWRLAQAFSALNPSGTDEKRWVDGVLARKKDWSSNPTSPDHGKQLGGEGMALDLPGTPIRPPNKPGRKQCPNCKRFYAKVKIKKDGQQITRHCPYCGFKVG